MGKEINGYTLTRAWFELCANNIGNPDVKITPTHTAVFFFAVNRWNICGQRTQFSLPTKDTADNIGISTKTYYSVINDLCNWKFLILNKKGTSTSIAPLYSIGKIFHSSFHSKVDSSYHSKVVGEVEGKSHLIEPKNIEPINKEIDTKVSKKKSISLYEFRLLVEEAISISSFSDKFTEKSIQYFYEWAKTEKKVSTLRKIKSDLPTYFQKEIDYLSKYAPNQIEYMLEQASRKCYVSYVEKDLPEPQRVIKPQFQELYSNPEPIKPKEPIQFNIPDEFK